MKQGMLALLIALLVSQHSIAENGTCVILPDANSSAQGLGKGVIFGASSVCDASVEGIVIVPDLRTGIPYANWRLGLEPGESIVMGELSPGQWVRHPTRPDWGLGQVQSAIGRRVTVNFEHAGKVLIDIEHVALEAIENPAD